jgi:hypothetical protein
MRFWATCLKHYEIVEIRLALQKKSGFVIELLVLLGCDFCWFVDCCLAPHGSIPACEVIVDSSPSG